MDVAAPRLQPLRRAANASQSFRDASFIDQGKTDSFTDRTPLPRRSRTNPADCESEWTATIKRRGASECPASHAQMPSVRSSLCPPGSSRSAFFGDARAEEENRVTQ